VETTKDGPAIPLGLRPPGTWAGADFLRTLTSPWYRLVMDLHDVVLRGTVGYAAARGLRAMVPSMTTRTITCPTAAGSDSLPVPVTVGGVDTYLPDSAQFLLEYGCRLAPGGCYDMLPSFRGEDPDDTHLGQYVHSEAELPGGLDEMIHYVEGYLRHLAAAVLDEVGDRIPTTAHLSRLADRRGGFERITFEEAVTLLSGFDGDVVDGGGWRTLTRQGERRLMTIVDEFVWVTHFDHLSVPFYQGFGDPQGKTATNADLFFGMGEVVGGGARHTTGDEMRAAMAMHAVPEADYDWYVRMKDHLPMPTAGFGMGVERFLMWVLSHHDIRDIPLVSRVDESPGWPERVDRP
jgi:asparaginyl-tRNA synthetase